MSLIGPVKDTPAVVAKSLQYHRWPMLMEADLADEITDSHLFPPKMVITDSKGRLGPGGRNADVSRDHPRLDRTARVRRRDNCDEEGDRPARDRRRAGGPRRRPGDGVKPVTLTGTVEIVPW